MSKRNKRSGFWKGMGVGALLALLFACGPPKSEPTPTFTACTGKGAAVAPAAPVLYSFYESNMPCAPQRGQRVGFYLENDGAVGSRTATCNALDGAATPSNQPGWDFCDYVDVTKVVEVLGVALPTQFASAG